LLSYFLVSDPFFAALVVALLLRDVHHGVLLVFTAETRLQVLEVVDRTSRAPNGAA
jgi:hypothetical protein